MFSKLFAFSTLLGLLSALPANAAQIEVVAGGPDGLIQYNPSFVTANPGDVITFVFKQKNHTVTQSTLETPCSPLPGGFDTGFMPVAENKEPFPRVQYTVKDTNPVWFYCRQTAHCQKGMVFAINPGQSGKLVEFQENARKTPLTPAPPSTPTPPPTPPPTAKPAQIEVVAGGPDGLIQYNPSFVTANPGDVITFIFKQKNHTVTQSTLETPCSPLPGGFDTGFMFVPENKEPFPRVQYTVKDTNPVWFYCRQTAHCQKGMVFAINPGQSGKLVEFQENARKTPLTPNAKSVASRRAMREGGEVL